MDNGLRLAAAALAHMAAMGITLGDIAPLLDGVGDLAVHCPHCRRWADLKLHELVMRGGRVQPSRVSRWVLTSPIVEDFPCRVVLSVHTCRRQYPGEASGCHCRSLPLTCQPSPRFPTGSAFALLFSESAQRSLLVAARVVAKPPKVALYTEGFDRFLPPRPLRLLPAGEAVAGWVYTPTERAHVFTAHEKSRLAERLEQEGVPDTLIVRALEVTGRSLGHAAPGAKKDVRVNVVDHLETLDENLTRVLRRKKAQAGQATDAEPQPT
jgi:hypothetical protein